MSVTVPTVVVNGNMGEGMVWSMGPGVTWTLVLPPSSCGTWGTFLNLEVLICKRGASLRDIYVE